MPVIPNNNSRKVKKKSREQCKREGITWKPTKKYLKKALQEEEENTRELNLEVFERIFNRGMFGDFRRCENLFR
jgi:hypothetical protein